MASKSEKLINEICEMTVLELSEFVKALEEKLGPVAMPAMAAPAAATADAGAKQEEEKSQYKVELTDGGADKIKTIKALRTVTTLGLTEAKKLVEGAPAVIVEAATKADANKIKETLEAAGAKVKLS